jgi:TRAP-type mannitol/chloroaromatic compound transport system permease small subunit
MLSVTVTCSQRFECAFELATKQHGRVFLFAAEQEEDRRKWVDMLAKVKLYPFNTIFVLAGDDDCMIIRIENYIIGQSTPSVLRHIYNNYVCV